MADFNDFRVSRNEDGEVETVTTESPRMGFKIEMVPLTIGDTYQLEGWGDSSQSDWSLRDKAYMLRNNVVTIDGEDVGLPEDEDDAIEAVADGFKPYAVDDVILAIVLNSGLKDMVGENNEGKEIDEMLTR